MNINDIEQVKILTEKKLAAIGRGDLDEVERIDRLIDNELCSCGAMKRPKIDFGRFHE